MVAKEWRDARWKFAVATILVLLLSTYLTPYSEIVATAEEIGGMTTGEGRDTTLPPPVAYNAERMALDEMWGFYNVGGLVALGSLVLGATLISGETGSGTISLLLSRPLSRTRILLTKYAVCAAVLLTAAVLGGVLILTVAALRGYPMDDVSYPGVLLLGLMMWLMSVFVLGVALLVSVFFCGAIPSLAVTALALLAFFTFPENVLNVISIVDYRILMNSQSWYEFFYRLAPGPYLIAPGVFEGDSPGAAKFLYWTIAAAVPLLAAVWIFRKKSY